MRGKVVRPGERPLTLIAAERLDSRVLPHVSRELVRAGEAPLAEAPITAVRTLARVDAKMGLQVGAFRVDLFAS